MPYIPEDWKDHIVDPQTGEVIQHGTKVSAARLINMENGIKRANDALDSPDPIPVTVSQGTSVIDAVADSLVKLSGLQGRTLLNILGRDGGCESLTPFALSGAPTLSTAWKMSGTYSIKFAPTDGMSLVRKDYTYPLDTSKQYIVGVWAYVESYTSGGAALTLRDVGTDTARYVANVDTSKVGVQQFIYVKVPTANTLVGTGFRLHFGVNTAGTMAVYFDEIRIYELSSADYNAIGTTYITGEQIDRFIPYVDDLKSMFNPYAIVEGANQNPPFTDGWTLHANATIDSEYGMTVTSSDTANKVSYKILPVVSGQTYSLSKKAGSTARVIVQKYDTAGAVVATDSGTFTVDETYNGFIALRVDNAGQAGTFSINDIMLNLGSTALPFEERKISYKFYDVELRDTPNIGGKPDTIFIDENGNEMVLRKHKNMVLDGTLPWVFVADYIGFKAVQLQNIPTGIVASPPSAIKYDGKILVQGQYADGSDRVGFHSSGNYMYFSIADSDSGWDNVYRPVINEQKAFFNGWKVSGYTAGTAVADELTASLAANGTHALVNGTAGQYRALSVTKSPDNVAAYVAAVEGTDYTLSYDANGKLVLTNKTGAASYFKISYTYGTTPNAWVSVYTGAASPTQTLEYVSNNKAPGWTEQTAYKLQYELAQPVPEAIVSEGELMLKKGLNQVTMGAGVIVREAITSVVFDNPTNGYVANGSTANPFKYRNSKILEVFKGISRDEWTIYNRGTAHSTFGMEYVSARNGIYDPVAAYSVTYLALDMYALGFAPQQIVGTYEGNINEVVNQHTKILSQHGTRLSVVENEYARKQQGGWITPTLVGGAARVYTSDVFGYYKNEFGEVRVTMFIDFGVTPPSETLFMRFIEGHRPKLTARVLGLTYSTLTDQTTFQGYINPNGEFRTRMDANKRYVLLNFSFRAEQ